MTAPTTEKAITFFHTTVTPRAMELVAEVLRTGWLNEGEITKQFEAELARLLRVANPVALNSGTAALHLALELANIQAGDEVIIPPQTFVATGLVVLQMRAKPVFCDIDPWTGNLDPASLQRCLTPKTRAIIPVHWGGYPCEMDEIHAFAAAHRLTVIEDAAHALGATYKGRPIGSISRYTAFSFQAIKHLTTGDGGLLCCPDPKDAEQARIRRWFGIDRSDMRRSILGDRGFDIASLGFKYHMNNVAAAIGLGNLEAFPATLARRQAITSRYRAAFASTPGLHLLRWKDDRTHAWWVFTIRVDERENFVRALQGRGVPATVVDLSIDRNSVLGGLRTDLPGQTEFNANQIALPCHEGLSDNDVDRVIAAVQAGW
ncbi:MAG TPA: DegT/DnrJ/EryC1/StrS family aminotransferase [Gemmatimonadales bacterium]|nr:DegT/DnrJ/EryC1/StrS family aminotransferase [Gemmatimonadales bacterium]